MPRGNHSFRWSPSAQEVDKDGMPRSADEIRLNRQDQLAGLPRYQRRQLGDDALVAEEDRLPDQDLARRERADRASTRDLEGDGRDDPGRDAGRDQWGAVHGATRRHSALAVVYHGRATLHEAGERVRKLHDRIGAAVDGALGEVVRVVQDRTAAALRASRSLAAARRVAERAGDAPDRRLLDVRPGVAASLDLTDRCGRQRPWAEPVGFRRWIRLFGLVAPTLRDCADCPCLHLCRGVERAVADVSGGSLPQAHDLGNRMPTQPASHQVRHVASRWRRVGRFESVL